MMASSSVVNTNEFEKWLNDALHKHTKEDSSIFLNYILSLLNEEETQMNDKMDSIVQMLHELNPDKESNDVNILTNEIIKKWCDSQNNQNFYSSEDSNSNHKIQNQSCNDDPGDTISNLIKEYKHQVIDVKKKPKSTEIDQNLYESTNLSNSEDYDDDLELHDQYDNGLFENSNLKDALEREKQAKDKLHESYVKQKERIKKDQIAQKEKEEERKRKAKQRAAKVERKC